jgi:hypothetical protein
MHSTFLFSSRCAIVQQDHKKYRRAIGTSRTQIVSAHAGTTCMHAFDRVSSHANDPVSANEE